MFKNQPRGLIAAALANMGERFGFYTMMAILSLFLLSKFGLDETQASLIYSIFYFSIYGFAFLGGIIADRTNNFKGTIFVGLIMMSVGYLLLSIPTPTPVPEGKMFIFLGLTCFGLFVIAFGNGLFKGNLQALVGQMYDNKEYAHLRDSGFSLFYMFINVGAIFAPFFAVGVRNWWINLKGFDYNPDLSALSHSLLKGTITPEASIRMNELAASMGYTGEMTTFANNYLNAFATGFHYAFAVAIFAMIISMVIFITNKNRFPNPSFSHTDNKSGSKTPEMDIVEIKQRMYALFAVFGVVIFFWFSFHQNGLTLTYFANDYTRLSGINVNIGFTRIQGAELFQSINPLFVVLLTPILLAFFGWLRAKGIEPSTPKKIAIGMGIAASAYVLMSIGSIGLPNKDAVTAMGGLQESARVTPWLLIGTYFILTVAELFISPLGISFVSKVAPPKFQGMAQGLWLCATAIGNQLLFIGTIFYTSTSISGTWMIFVGACVISMLAMMSMVKWLERVAK
jgi:POT family proton-dependent oligopeptide transporter